MAKVKKLKIICDACCHVPNANLKGNVGRKGKAAGGILFLDENDTVIDEFGAYFGEKTVPQAEYQAVIVALDKASGICRNQIEIWTDSELIVRQMNGDYGIKSGNIKPLFDELKKLEKRFDVVKYFHHGKKSVLGKKADALAEKEYRRHNP